MNCKVKQLDYQPLSGEAIPLNNPAMALFYLITSILTFIAFLNCLIFVVWSYVTHNPLNSLRNGCIALGIVLLVVCLLLGRKAITLFRQQDRSHVG